MTAFHREFLHHPLVALGIFRVCDKVYDNLSRLDINCRYVYEKIHSSTEVKVVDAMGKQACHCVSGVSKTRTRFFVRENAGSM